MTETSVVDPIAQVLDQFFWVNSAVRQVLFYSAVYAASGGKPENAYAYLEKRIPGLEGILTALPETIIDDPATAHLNKANKILEQVGKLTKRDFGYLPDHFATRADNVFHDSPQTRSVFLDDLNNVWHDTLHVKHGLGYTDVTQRILGTSIENARIVLLDHAPEAWSVVSLFTTDIGNFYTLATAFACLHLIRANAGQASQADDAYCLVIAPSFNLQAVRYSSRLGNGVSLIDATGIWQMQHKLSDKSKAAEVARRLPEFLVHHHGLLNIEAAFAALGID